MKLDRSFTVTSMEKILALMSISIHQSNEKHEKLYVNTFTIATLLFVCDGLYVLLNATSFINILDTSFHLVTAFGFLIAFHWTRTHREDLLQIHRFSISNEFLSDESLKMIDRDLKTAIFHFCSVWLWGTVSVCFYPILVAVFTEAEYGSPSTLLFPTHIPWKIDSAFMYCLTVTFQILTVPIPVIICCAFVCFSLYCFVVIRFHYEAIKDKIRGITNTLDVSGGRYDDEKAIDELYSTLQYFGAFTAHVNRVIVCVTPHFHFSLLIFFFSLVAVSAVLILVKGNLIYQLKMFNIEITACIPFMLQCYIADEIFHMKQSIMVELYQISWYDHSLRFKREMLLFMTVHQAPFRLKLCKFYILNFQFLTTLLRYSYSVQQFLLKTQK